VGGLSFVCLSVCLSVCLFVLRAQHHPQHIEGHEKTVAFLPLQITHPIREGGAGRGRKADWQDLRKFDCQLVRTIFIFLLDKLVGCCQNNRNRSNQESKNRNQESNLKMTHPIRNQNKNVLCKLLNNNVSFLDKQYHGVKFVKLGSWAVYLLAFLN